MYTIYDYEQTGSRPRREPAALAATARQRAKGRCAAGYRDQALVLVIRDSDGQEIARYANCGGRAVSLTPCPYPHEIRDGAPAGPSSQEPAR